MSVVNHVGWPGIAAIVFIGTGLIGDPGIEGNQAGNR